MPYQIKEWVKVKKGRPRKGRRLKPEIPNVEMARRAVKHLNRLFPEDGHTIRKA